MLAELHPKDKLGAVIKPTLRYIQHPVTLIRTYDRANLQPDLIAGLTVAVMLLPQGIAFALIAELPVQMGIYSAIIGAIVGGLWGSSNQLQTGPANAHSLLIASTLATTMVVGTPEYILAASVIAVMAGIFQLVLGLARVGILVNFVSYSVVVGFATGAGGLIVIKQLKVLLGLTVYSSNSLGTITGTIIQLPETHLQTAVIGIGSIILNVILKRLNPKLPSALITMATAAFLVYIFNLDQSGVAIIGEFSGGLPPLSNLPLDFSLISRLTPGAIAIAAIGLVQASAISRSIATQTGQRLDSNQEFVGQGLANIACGLFSGFPVTGSFARSGINFEAGARTPLASLFAGILVLFIMLTLAPLLQFIPMAALAGILIVIGFSMIDREEIKRIWQGAPGDAAIMMLTLFGTLFFPLEFAVFFGILLSFALYVLRTSSPSVKAVVPDVNFRHFIYNPEQEPCPQLLVIEILGDLYFGAVGYVEDTILDLMEKNPTQRFLLLRMHSVAHIDFSGIHMLENIVRTYREAGGDVFMVRVGYTAHKVMESTEFVHFLGETKFLKEDEAIHFLFNRRLDPAICIYECPLRVFKECQNLPKRIDLVNIPTYEEGTDVEYPTIEPHTLWTAIHNGQEKRPFVIDVREPREFSQGHVPNAHSIPLGNILAGELQLPSDQDIVLVCRSGRRSRRAALALSNNGREHIIILKGGMVAWAAAGLLEAVEF